MKSIFNIVSSLTLIIVLSYLVACQHDDTARDLEISNIQDTHISIHMESGDHLRYLQPKVFRKLVKTSQSTKMLSVAKDGTGSDPYSLALNTIQIIERNTYTQYTTAVNSHSQQDIYLINYMLIEFDDGSEYQFLIKYPRVTTVQGSGLDYTNAVMEAIYGETLLTKSGVGGSRPCLNGVPELVSTTQQYICETTRCTGPERHKWGMECPCANLNYCTMPTRTCGWETLNVWSCTGGGSSSGTGSDPTGGGNNDPNNPNQDDVIETVPLIPNWEQVVDCVNGGLYDSLDPNVSLPLSTDDISWLQSQVGSVHADNIVNHINDNGCENNRPFIDEAIETLRDGGEVDFTNEIIFKIEQECAKDIAKKIINNSSQLSQNILSYFNQNKNYVIKYTNTDIVGTAVAATSIEPQCDNGKCIISIFLDNDLLNDATDLLIAKVILHETIHAALNYLFQTEQFNNQGLDPNASTNPDYKALVEAYTQFLANENPRELIGPIQVLEHQYMTIFVNDMINTLKTVGLSMGYQEDSPQLSDSYLKDLIWSGSLEETSYFGTNFTFTEQERIHYRGVAELSNSIIVYQIFDENGIPTNITIQPLSNVINNADTPCFSN